jgi:transposase
VNAVVYQLRAGGGVAVAPPDFPPWQTVSGRFRRWQQDGTWDRVADGIRGEVRPADWSE